MENQEIKSKWDDLAREIGAELSAEAQQRAETHAAVSEGDETGAAESLRAPRAPLPKKPAADWAGLAGELGLPPLEEEPLAVEKPSAKPTPRDDDREPRSRQSHMRETESREFQPREQVPREARPRGPRRGRGGGQRRDRRDDQREGGESGERRRERSGPRRDREASRRQENRPGPSDERREHGEPQREAARPRDFGAESSDEPFHEPPPLAEATSPTPEREPAAKSPAVSLWHKIFGAPVEPVVETAETPPEDVSVLDETQDERESQSEFGGSEIRSLSGQDVTAAGFVEDRSDLSATEDQGEQAERSRGRSRRRRRGGRGRKSSGRQREGRSAEPRIHEQGGDDQVDADFDDLGDDMDSQTDNDNLMESRPADGDTDLDDLDGEQAPSHTRSMSAAQRAIPTWDDAIGFIVESNMQSRSQRPRPSRSDSRGNSRGRSRGGRRK
jgi:hypothetical protein